MKEKIVKLLKKFIEGKIATKDIKIEIPREKKFGDYSTNIAFILARIIKMPPQKIAKDLAKKISLKKIEFLEKVESQNGFVNFYLKPEWLTNQLKEILEQKEKFGTSFSGKNQKVQVEFISANPTGPLTIGNARGGVIGDVLASVLEKSGWRVTREYYFNDAGGQIDDLGHSVLGDEKAVYQGEYIDGLSQKLKIKSKKLFEEKNYREIGKLAAKELIKDIKVTTQKMGINFDVWFAEEADLREKGKIQEIVKWLHAKKLVYKKDGALWFSAHKFGDDKDRVLIRKNGEPTYFGVDCAYHKNKFIDRAFDWVIDIWGADHYGDVKRVKGFIKALGYADKFKIILHQFVRLVRAGKEVRMSKRKGIYILVDDLLAAVGRDVFRFFMLSYAPSSHLDFDLEKARERSEKNPVYYIQYVSARIHGILAKIKNQKLKIKTIEADPSLLKESEEIDLIKHLIKYPDLSREIAENFQVQQFPTYAIGLADKFHNFYEKCQVISEKKDLEQARILLLKATQIVLKNCLKLMGISAPEKM